MCVEYCVKISYKSDKKMKKVIAYTIWLEYLTWAAVIILERGVTHSREGRGWGNGEMSCFFLTMLANDIPTTFLTCNMQRKRVWDHTTVTVTTRQHLSITPAFTGCAAFCVALRNQLSSLYAAISQNSTVRH